VQAGADSYGELADLLPIDERTLLRTAVAIRDRGLLAADHGAPGSALGIPGAPPPSADDLLRIVAATVDIVRPTAIA